VTREAIGKEACTNSMMRLLDGVFGAAVFAGTDRFVSAKSYTDGPCIGISAALALVETIAGMWLLGRRAAALKASRKFNCQDRVHCQTQNT
jgi:hypothetical protein